LTIVTDLLVVHIWGDLTFALSFPILLSAGMVFSPLVAGLMAFAGSTDPREFRREISIGHGLFNRSQIALSVLVASWIFHLLGGRVEVWPFVLLASMSALFADMLVNGSLVILVWRLAGMHSVREALNGLVGGQPASFLLLYACFGLAAILLAEVYWVAGDWGLLVFIVPILLARQVFVSRYRLRDMATVISNKTRALLTISERIFEERRDERLSVAAGLHDEILPPLYRVHLMGQVLRQDLASGRLFNLEEDLPELLGATEEASAATQSLIRSLRSSTIGSGGLLDTLRLLVREMQSTSSSRIHLRMEEVGGSPVVQLLAYQVAREGLRNAVRHANASQITITLAKDSPDMRLVIEDDGDGFDPRAVDESSHFGLQLMRERVELAGGVLLIDTSMGMGTRVVARLPAERSI
jgi:signal transduction histidine kinase